MREESFLSSHDINKPSTFSIKGTCLSLIMGQGKPIKVYSDFPEEEEILFPPGTYFYYESYHQENGKHYFILNQVEGLPPTLTTTLTLTKRDLEREKTLSLESGKCHCFFNRRPKTKPQPSIHKAPSEMGCSIL